MDGTVRYRVKWATGKVLGLRRRRRRRRNFLDSVHGYATAVVEGETRSLAINNGWFTDAFADKNAVHIYRSDGGSTCGQIQLAKEAGEASSAQSTVHIPQLRPNKIPVRRGQDLDAAVPRDPKHPRKKNHGFSRCSMSVATTTSSSPDPNRTLRAAFSLAARVAASRSPLDR
jgi:hypothetical protein